MNLERKQDRSSASIIRSLANGKAVGPDRVSVELFNRTFKGAPDLRRRLLDIVVCTWRGGGAVAVETSHHRGTLQKKKIEQSAATIGVSRWQCTPAKYS